MKRLGVVTAGLAGLLAGCGSFGAAPDGSGGGRIEQMRTEYKLGSTFIACDNIANNVGRSSQTQVGVRFVLSGSISTVTVSLKGVNSSQYDNNFKETFTRDQLQSVDTNTYRALFNANSATGAFLPQAIVVNPAPVKIKTVTASDQVGEFYAQLDVNTGSATYSFNGNSAPFRVPVYRNCTVTGDTGENV
ncbi:hypothetical protein K7W42_19880 [Deinococcus sp. HMF7604]|uniref:hypothetical protein n=1 Tax=Deinococcus betulae TaxID=2873312 RepID=UPI001CD00DC9|nr:hypothetical protein [Deinococcus betulae]MBZ9753101.1 hypothetical protein [Deinococcus betulae]